MSETNYIDYWRVIVDDEDWIVEGRSVKEVYNKILLEKEDAEIDSIERTGIVKILV